MYTLNNIIAKALVEEKVAASGNGHVQSQLASTVAAVIYKIKGITVAQSVAIAAVVADSLTDVDILVDAFLDSFSGTKVFSKQGDVVEHDLGMTGDEAVDILVEAGIFTKEDGVGDELVKILERDTTIYTPAKAGAVKRKFKNYGLEKDQASGLLHKAINVLERTDFTIDTNMLVIAQQVQARTGGPAKDDEAHVLHGCASMSGEQAYNSEFKADRRSRLYQAACSGPNGQASDRSRALMDLHGVEYTDEQIPEIKRVIRAEVMDMVKVPESEVGKLMGEAIADPVTFIIKEEAKPKKERDVPKMWSFVKAAFIWSELAKGNKPYVGMAVGYDAKCSGPQLGALMSGDAKIAAACGMTLTQVSDAYELAIVELDKVGLTGFTRAGIKKAYMGIFYGQGYAAFMDFKQLAKDEQFEILEIFKDATPSEYEDIAKMFHGAVSKSFGPSMNQLRKRFKNYMDRVEGRCAHMMPDGFKVQMNYKVKHNINDVAMDFGVEAPDVIVVTPNYEHKFIKLQLKTSVVDTTSFVRNGFVNLIQGTDALIAKLIIVHLDRLGAKHVIAVHDCFRVNVTELDLLEEAIKCAYMDLFGNDFNTATEDLPAGTDIIGLYFAGMDKSLIEGEKGEQGSQFIKTRTGHVIRKARKLNGTPMKDLIQALGTSYYFAK